MTQERGVGDTVARALAAAAPPSGSVVREWTLLAVTELAVMRAQLTEVLSPDAHARRDGAPEWVGQLVLIASELATNALWHGAPPTTVRLVRAESAWVLDVADGALDLVPQVESDRAPGDGGFGLQLAHLLAADVGWYATGETKHVWASFPA